MSSRGEKLDTLFKGGAQWVLPGMHHSDTHPRLPPHDHCQDNNERHVLLEQKREQGEQAVRDTLGVAGLCLGEGRWGGEMLVPRDEGRKQHTPPASLTEGPLPPAAVFSTNVPFWRCFSRLRCSSSSICGDGFGRQRSGRH